ncbi:ABC transporter ATP-binding protein [Thiocapsa imhoffii]|uniref:ABC transporter ATP-binding protein n=1 Tax=Thiocapsa imhoffii TaxID=382777 RepID=A0A9X1B8L6_9GAMM|nr:ABC transporter ATP-binding protein [Thiocapsa imhoffii]MBK1644897.1 ABC transporter ATP-binding protein [Thiocapsa imhoffii]
MSSTPHAISVQDLGKCYQIYERPQDRLKQSIVPRLRRLMGLSAPDYYKEFWALRDLSFSVHQGETVGIIGRNGSGKSTLLQIICGTLTPTTGRVETTGRVAALLELGAGFNPEFTGRENVYLNASVLGLTEEQIDVRFDAIAAFADIGDFIEQPVKTYSSGMYVRLAFAVIAHVEADILVIDEALSVGDVFFTQKCMRFLRGFMEQGTVIFVSHDTSAVQNLCQRAIWIERGAVRFIGPAKEAAERYLEALYESQQGASTLAQEEASPPEVEVEIAPEPQDMRLRFLNCTQFRNDIEIFAFDPSAPAFGKGDGRITSVALIDANGAPYSWVVGGEDVILEIGCQAHTAMYSPIIGFFVRDHLGQPLFGDNTYVTYSRAPKFVEAGKTMITRFAFRMPILRVGDYSMTVALAEGTQQEHVQHHWIHDAIVFKSHTSSVATGLVGIPMQSIEIRVDS